MASLPLLLPTPHTGRPIPHPPCHDSEPQLVRFAEACLACFETQDRLVDQLGLPILKMVARRTRHNRPQARPSSQTRNLVGPLLPLYHLLHRLTQRHQLQTPQKSKL